MPRIKRREVRQRYVTALALVAVALLIATELLSGELRQFWASHVMTAAMVAFMTSVLLTVLIVEEIRRRGEASRWENVSWVAYRKLSGAAFKVCAGFLQATGFENAGEYMVEAGDYMEETGMRPGIDAPTLLPEGYEENLSQVIDDPKFRQALREAIEPLMDELDEALARWAPVMLGTPNLAERLELFSLIRDSFRWIIGSLDRYADSEHEKVMFWSNLRAFLLLNATFDSLRREALCESTGMFGETLEEHDRAWGLPFKAQKWLWEKKRQSDCRTNLM